jgi:hypothetical protein
LELLVNHQHGNTRRRSERPVQATFMRNVFS